MTQGYFHILDVSLRMSSWVTKLAIVEVKMQKHDPVADLKIVVTEQEQKIAALEAGSHR